MFYDYKCSGCGETTTDNRSFEVREVALNCSCGGSMEYQFPVSAILGFQPFEPYWDEALGCDINGRREKKQVLKAMNLVEAGDAQHGGINFDKHAPDHIKPRSPVGLKYDNIRKDKEENKMSVSVDHSMEQKTKSWLPERDQHRVKTDRKGHIVK